MSAVASLLSLLSPETAHRAAIRALPWLPAHRLPALPRLRTRLAGLVRGRDRGGVRLVRDCRTIGIVLQDDRAGLLHDRQNLGQEQGKIGHAGYLGGDRGLAGGGYQVAAAV